VIFLLHLQKTGGQTLAMRLAQAFSPERSKIMVGQIADRAELHALASQYEFIAGHPGYGLLDKPPEGLTVICLIRDPVEHLISLYRHVRRDPFNSLNVAANAMGPKPFLDRFSHYFFDFQARGLTMALRLPGGSELSYGEDAWITSHLEEAVASVRWLVPTEALDDFCALWRLETGFSVGQAGFVLNAAEQDRLDLTALRHWLRSSPERFALDSLLWRRARKTYSNWRKALLARDANGEPPIGHRVWTADDGAAVWLTDDWHPPVTQNDGTSYWWCGPGFFSRLSIRRKGRNILFFEALTFIGVHWDQISFLSGSDRKRLPHKAAPQESGSVIAYTISLDMLADEDEILMVGIENAVSVPPVPLAWEQPRRGFATRLWKLA
jgi:hypothetical protein